MLHASSSFYSRFFPWWTFVTLPSPPFSYRYNFYNDDWNAVYKHTMGKNFKVKAGYDSEVQVGWASFWVCTLHLLCFARAASLPLVIR